MARRASMTSVDRFRWWLIRSVAVVLAAVPLLRPTDRSPWEFAVLAAAGLAHAEVGTRMWRARPDSRVGPIMVASGLVWLLSTWDPAAPSAHGAGGLILSTVYEPMQLHCALIIPAGRLITRPDRFIGAVAYLYWPV